MSMTKAEAKTSLTIAGGDLHWLMGLVQKVQDSFSVTVVHHPNALSTITVDSEGRRQAAIVELHTGDSAIDVRHFLERSPGVRVTFVADEMPLRHAVARVIRERGHAVVSRREPAFIIAATVAALMASREAT
jgi:hypothetical protein